ncbi:hypothetical protein [Streptomyces roseolilacinus]|uniref:Uncharacterized protein n=1 Tax=Streptomyces roseolilacinus TaxID=66904 RepID=A0A918B6E0_9ACTN|nr:hypothetical protein [Streptomyces roseolilacinus]GGQ33734.1 hypothetical protein GCM10010249_60290 [Streptomyces roseolilacinus]
MELVDEGRPGRLEVLAEEAVVAACALADAVSPGGWSAGAVEDVASALEVLAGALARLGPEYAEILAVVPVAAAAVAERAEQARIGTAPRGDASGASATVSVELRRALAAHGIMRHRVHQFGAALLSLTLEPADAQALAALLAPSDGSPRQAPPAEPGWGEGSARTAAAALTEALISYGAGAYARVLDSGHVSAGLPPQAARNVITALTAPAAPPPRGRRRGLGHGYRGIGGR